MHLHWEKLLTQSADALSPIPQKLLTQSPSFYSTILLLKNSDESFYIDPEVIVRKPQCGI